MGLFIWVTLCLSLAASSNCVDYTDDPIVQLFREYVQINTTTNGNLTPAVDFWKKLAAEEDLPISVYEFEEGYPVIVIKWEGSDPSLESVMLNSHMDVVPADINDGWLYPPFDAVMDSNGDIYGRGTQDMKSVALQYFEALRRIKANNITLLRTCYQTFMPDEEVGGTNGMQSLLPSDEFAAMNVGVAMDEGTSYPIPQIAIFKQDKVVWQIQVDCHGVAAHGSSFPATNDTATGKCNNVVNRMFEFREEQYKIYEVATVLNSGSYTATNLNKVNGGTANNIIPELISLVFDIRPATDVNETAFFAQLNEWLAEAGDNITLTRLSNDRQSPATIVNSTNPYWVALETAAAQVNITIVPIVAPGSTDSRFVRNIGIPAFGFSPMPNTPLLLHSVNEYLNAKTFLDGIDIYVAMIQALANVPGNSTSTERFAYVKRVLYL